MTLVLEESGNHGSLLETSKVFSGSLMSLSRVAPVRLQLFSMGG